jgi:hypothetical protein
MVCRKNRHRYYGRATGGREVSHLTGVPAASGMTAKAASRKGEETHEERKPGECSTETSPRWSCAVCQMGRFGSSEGNSHEL